MSNLAYNFLGRSGLKVSNICLGTMTFGKHPSNRPWTNELDAHFILDKYTELGGNFIDTADSYQQGESENIIGNWLTKQTSSNRQKYVIASKVRRIWDPADVNSVGLSRKHIMWSIDESLKRLKTDYLDLYYMHVWDSGVPLEESLQAMNDLITMGKIRYIGLSNFKGWQIQKAVEISKQRNWAPIVALQQQYNLLCRTSEWEVCEVCENEGISLLPWGPLKGGYLSGNIDKTLKPKEGSRINWASTITGRASHSHPNSSWFDNQEKIWNVIDCVEEVAKFHGKSIPQTAIKWLLQKKVVSSVVIGARTIEHLSENIQAGYDWKINEKCMEQLNTISDVKKPYPYDYVDSDNINRVR